MPAAPSPSKSAGTGKSVEKPNAVLTNAPGDGNAIGGIKVETRDGWFAARPSGTEYVYKIYAESFRDGEHLKRIQREAQDLIAQVMMSQ